MVPAGRDGNIMLPAAGGGNHLAALFEPRSIAVVGASANPEKRGHQILRALDESGYGGRVFAVNRAGGRILGRTAFPSVTGLPEAVDLAVLCIPARATPAVVRECGARGVRGAVVLAVGFGESGRAGRRLERELQRAGRETGVRIVGPNTSGLLNLPLGLNLIGARGVRPGKVALLTQSGNIALGLMNELSRQSRLGISVCCGLGNETDVGFGEVLSYLGTHRNTEAIVMHIEGCRDARQLLRSANAVTRQKPVIALKSGRTGEGASAARSHTGTVAGPYERLRAGFRQAGLVEVTRTDELVPVAITLASQPAGEAGSAIGVLSDGGGQSTLVMDRLHQLGAPLARLTRSTSKALRARLGPAAAVTTPVDVAGAADSDPGAFASALAVIGADPAVGTVLVVGMFGGYAIRFSETLADAEAASARAMARLMRASGKGFVVHSQFASHRSEALEALREAGVPVIGSLEAACRAAFELHRRGREPARERRWRPGPSRKKRRTPHPVIVAARAERRVTLSEVESRTLLAEAGLRPGPMEVAESEAEAAAAATRLGGRLAIRRASEVPDDPKEDQAATGSGGRLAIKLLSRHILHKSEVGGVVLGVPADDGGRAAATAFHRIVLSAEEYAAAHGLPREKWGATVAPMLPAPVAELLVGACHDPQLGPVLTLGSGGIFVEVLRDVVHRVLPVEPEEVEAALGELRVRALLDGARGRPAVSREPIVEAAAAVVRCLSRWPEVAEVEVNPLFVYRDRVAAVDARVVLRPDR